MQVQRLILVGFAISAVAVVRAEATIISFSADISSFGAPAAIIPPPGQVLNSGVTNRGQQGFDEQQGVLLGALLLVDGGSIAAGAVVDSHMIFLNREQTPDEILFHTVTWTFSGNILGVMSDQDGMREAASTPILGWPATTYPDPMFGARGLENTPGNTDVYSILGNQLTLDLRVTAVGDWVRVITAPAPAPEPGTLMLIGAGLAGLALRRRRS